MGGSGRRWRLSPRATKLRAEFTEQNKPLQALALKPGALPDPDQYLVPTVYNERRVVHAVPGRAVLAALSLTRSCAAILITSPFSPITTAQFAEYLRKKPGERAPGESQGGGTDAWLYEPGIPDSAPQTVFASARRR